MVYVDSPTASPEPEAEGEKSPKAILNELLGALVFLSSKAGVQMHVLRKLLSTLSRFFTKFPECWPNFIASTVATIATGKPLPEFNESIEEVCRTLSERNTVLGLEFCQVLIEDVKNANLENTQEAKVDGILNDNIPHLVILLRYASEILYPQVQQPKILEHVFKTYAAWALNHTMTAEYNQLLMPVTNFIFQYTEANPNSELYQLALEEISEILTRFPTFYNMEMKTYFAHILGQHGRPLIEQIEKTNTRIAQSPEPYIYDNDDEVEDMQELAQTFSKAAIALCELALNELSTTNPGPLETPEMATLIKYLLVISNFPGFPYVDHNLTMFMLEFWGTYADAYIQLEWENNEDAGLCIIQVIEIYWAKITLPLPVQQAHWKTDSWEAFDSFRKDFWEFLDMTYGIVGSQLFNTLVTNILEQLSSGTPPNWEKLEASLSCVNALSENITNEHALVAQLLQSPLLEQLAHLENMHIRTTGVNFIGSYSVFFEEDAGKAYLFPALDYLFKSLSIASLSTTASRSVLKLCSSCRTYLSSSLSSFFDTYTNMSLYAILGNASHERTVLAISYVIQAVEDVETKAWYVNQLITLILGQLEKVNDEYEQSKQLTDGPSKEAFQRIVSLLKCLGNIGKGLQVPDDFQGQPAKEQVDAMTAYWDADKFSIRANLLQVMRIFTIDRLDFRASVDICESCCGILKSGFSESVPGPFVFPINTVLEFIKAKHATGPVDCRPALVDLSCCFVSSHSVGSSTIPAQYVNSLLATFFSEVDAMLEYEPETQTSNLKLLRQIFTHYAEVFLDNPKIEVMIRFAVQMLQSTDRFAMREATAFWTSFIGLSPSSGGYAQQQAILSSVGPDLARTLVSKIAGDSARSELEYYSEVIKSLLSKQLFLAKPWFESALVVNPVHPVDKIDGQRRDKLCKQLVGLRGSRQTTQVVKQFWLASRGITDYL